MNLLINIFNELEYYPGTSYASPSIRGVAALLDAYLEEVQCQKDAAISLRNALL